LAGLGHPSPQSVKLEVLELNVQCDKRFTDIVVVDSCKLLRSQKLSGLVNCVPLQSASPRPPCIGIGVEADASRDGVAASHKRPLNIDNLVTRSSKKKRAHLGHYLFMNRWLSFAVTGRFLSCQHSKQ
jgi:hypothetical protein